VANTTLISQGNTTAKVVDTGSDGSFQVLTEGTERLRVDSSGRVGIGTDNPTKSLDVNSSALINELDVATRGATITSAYRGTTTIHSTSSSTNNPLSFVWEHSNTTTDIEQRINWAFGNAAGGDVYANAGYIGLGKQGTWDGGGNKSSYLAFGTINAATLSEKARIDNSGRLLLGTSTAHTVGSGQYSKLTVQGYVGGGGDTGAGYFSISRGQPATTPFSSTSHIGGLYFTDSAGATFSSIETFADGDTGSSDYPGRLVFSTTADGANSGTEQMRITSDRYVRLASGTGGIQFGGDTDAANALDDYEEGSWTPSMTFGGGSTGLTGSFTGTYTKIGRLVMAQFQLTLTNKGSSTGSLAVTGLPFTIGTNYHNVSGFSYMHRLNMGQTGGQIFIGATGTTMWMRRAGYSNTDAVILDDGDFTNITNLWGGIVYHV
jgi:hypothetical protein